MKTTLVLNHFRVKGNWSVPGTLTGCGKRAFKSTMHFSQFIRKYQIGLFTSISYILVRNSIRWDIACVSMLNGVNLQDMLWIVLWGVAVKGKAQHISELVQLVVNLDEWEEKLARKNGPRQSTKTTKPKWSVSFSFFFYYLFIYLFIFRFFATLRQHVHNLLTQNQQDSSLLS